MMRNGVWAAAPPGIPGFQSKQKWHPVGPSHASPWHLEASPSDSGERVKKANAFPKLVGKKCFRGTSLPKVCNSCIIFPWLSRKDRFCPQLLSGTQESLFFFFFSRPINLAWSIYLLIKVSIIINIHKSQAHFQGQQVRCQEGRTQRFSFPWSERTLVNP